ncbi:MAG: gliding motility-associated C-terminal domain-containing protein, partial [Saprospiraceae bacterium]
GIRTGLAVGAYEVTITEADTDCEEQQVSFTLEEPTCIACFTATVSVTKQPTCEDKTGSVAITVTGAKNALTYIWSDGVTTTTGIRTGLAVGAYEVTIVEADTDCEPQQVSFTLEEPDCVACFTADFNIIKQPDCNVANGTVAIITMGATNDLQYIWEDTILTDSVRTDLTAKDYEVIVKEDGTDCADTINFTLEHPMPPILILSPDTLCSDTAIGGLNYEITGCFVSPVNIQLLDSSGMVIITIENDTLGAGRIEELLPNQNYTFVATDATGEEIDSQVFMVIIPPKPAYRLFRDTVLCDGTAMTEIGIELSDSTTFAWLPHSNIADSLLTATTLNVPIGSYAISLNNGCPIMDSVVVQDGSIMVEIMEIDPLCMPGTTTLNVINSKSLQNLSYEWTPKATITSPTDTTDSPVVNVTETTQYNVAISNQLGCELLDSMTVIVADTTLLANIRLLPNQEKIPATGTSELSLSEPLPDGFTFEWQEDPTLDDRGERAIVSPTVNGTSYFANIFSEIAPQCTVTRDTAIWIGCDDDALFMPNAFSPNGDGINDVLYVRGADGFLSMNLIIYNRWGEKVFETSDADFGWDGRFKGKELGPDVYGYYLTVTCPGGVITKQGNVTLLK